MATGFRRAGRHARSVLRDLGPAAAAELLAPHFGAPPPGMPDGDRADPEAVARRWALLKADPRARAVLAAAGEIYARNIENFIGTVPVPVGIAGPLRVNGLAARGDYHVPLATTEAALVASYNRGAKLLTRAGGCTAVVLDEGVTRSPGFRFRRVTDASRFVLWSLSRIGEFRRVAESTTRHGRLIDLRYVVEGNQVFLLLEYTTGEAAGQNMVTIATQAVCEYIAARSPVKPQRIYVEANMSGDKKASMQSFLGVRGKKVTAEVILPAALVRDQMHVTPAAMAEYWRTSAVGGFLSGTFGVQGHYANGLAALFIACGQDAACVSEAAVGMTRLEVTANGSLYASVTLPNIIVGTVGGGTKLPGPAACLSLLGLPREDGSRALAEICAGLSLAGEVSIIGAICQGAFARAHQRLARGRAAPPA